MLQNITLDRLAGLQNDPENTNDPTHTACEAGISTKNMACGWPTKHDPENTNDPTHTACEEGISTKK